MAEEQCNLLKNGGDISNHTGGITGTEGSYFEIETGIIVVNGVTYKTYKKTIFTIGFPSTQYTWKVIPANTNAVGVLNVYGMIIDSGTPIPFQTTNNVSSYDIALSYNKSLDQIEVGVNSNNWASSKALVTIEYYK